MSTYRRFPRMAPRMAAAAALAGGALALVLAPAGTAGAATSLGGFTVSALAEGSTATYDQPNAPIPATPTLELDEGYAATTDNYGPSGSATASTLYPGQVVANAGPELSTLVPGVPLPAAPVWPIQAQATYPQTPNTASDDQPGATMASTSNATGNTATAQLGNAPTGSTVSCASTGAANSGSGGSGSGTPSLPIGLPSLPAGASSAGSTKSSTSSSGSSGSSGTDGLGATSSVAQLQSVSGTSYSGTANSVATASATATDACVSILGGLITIGSVTSTATATSNGTTGQVAGTTTVQNASIDGQPVTIDATGIHAAGQSSPSNPVLATLEQALTQLGITLTVTNPTDTVNGAQASRQLDGLRVQIDLTTLDKVAQQFADLIPASVTAELPVPVPDKQVLVLDLATVDVQATASPAFTTTAIGSGTSQSTAATTVVPPAATASSTGTATTAATTTIAGSLGGTAIAGTVGATGTSATPATSTTGTTPASGSGKPLDATDSSSSVPLAFKGIGAGLILLGLLAAGILGFASMRAGSAAEALPGGAACDLGEDDPMDEEGGER